jgi:hypothetical protein
VRLLNFNFCRFLAVSVLGRREIVHGELMHDVGLAEVVALLLLILVVAVSKNRTS